MIISSCARGAAALSGAVTLGQFGPALTGVPLITHTLPPGRPPAGTIWLTFDDGPHPDGTPRVLDLLRDFGATATFFVIGEQLVQQPDLAVRIATEGHALGIHGWNHHTVVRTAPHLLRRELARTGDLVAVLTGTVPTRYRPPYGVLSGSAMQACRTLGLSPTWWTAWGRDWSRQATARSVARCVETRPGPATVLLHDSDRYASPGSWHRTCEALELLLHRWRRRGLTVRAVPSPTGRWRTMVA